AQCVADGFLHFVVKFLSFFHHNKQRHPKFTSRLFDTHNKTVLDFFDGINCTINFACSDSHTTAVECGIRPAVDNDSVTRCDLDPIAMPPYTFVHFKVTLAVPDKIRIIPKVNRHRWHGLRDHHLAHLPSYGRPV